MGRWITIRATSPSGKTQFVCKFCGRLSQYPNHSCPTPPDLLKHPRGHQAGIMNNGSPGHVPDNGTDAGHVTCLELETLERQQVVADITWNSMKRAKTLLSSLEASTDEDAKLEILRRDRSFLALYLYTVFSEHFTEVHPHVADRIIRLYGTISEELMRL